MNCSRISSFVGAFSSRASLSFFHQPSFALRSGEHFGNSFTRAPAPGYPQPAPKLNYSFLLQPPPPFPPKCNVDGQCRDDEFFLHRPPGELGQHCMLGEGEGAATKTVVKFRCGLNEGNQVQEHVNVRYRPQLVHRVRHVSPSCR